MTESEVPGETVPNANSAERVQIGWWLPEDAHPDLAGVPPEQRFFTDETIAEEGGLRPEFEGLAVPAYIDPPRGDFVSNGFDEAMFQQALKDAAEAECDPPAPNDCERQAP